jgi:hypothetical protein
MSESYWVVVGLYFKRAHALLKCGIYKTDLLSLSFIIIHYHYNKGSNATGFFQIFLERYYNRS